ncbi:MAG: EpsG family protein [Bacteroides sp.]|nr:EpsG family protein [Bacteroides sp.]MBD5376069.1 EpsG family protein [Bacteroides sp.]
MFLFAVLETNHIPFNGRRRIYTYSYTLFISVIFFLSAIRWETGTDWPTYYHYFQGYTRNMEEDYMEPLFNLMNRINSSFDYQVQITEIAALSIFPIAWRYEKMSPYPLLTLYIWFSLIFAHLFPVRQTIAISIIVFSWKYIEQKCFKKYLVGVCLSICFHYSAIIALPLYFVWYRNIKIRWFIIIMITSTLCGLLLEYTVKNLLYMIGGDFFNEKLTIYMENSENSFGAQYTPRQALVRGIINRSLFLIIPLLVLNKKRELNTRLNALFNLGLYSYVLFVLVTPLSIALGRLTVFSDMFQALLIPYIFTLKMKNSSRIILLLIIGVYFLYRFTGVVNNYHDLYIPYKSFLMH